MLKTLSAYIKLKKPVNTVDNETVFGIRQPVEGMNGFCDAFSFSGISSDGTFLIARIAFRDSVPAELWFDLYIPSIGRISKVEKFSMPTDMLKCGPLSFACSDNRTDWRIIYKGRAEVEGKKQSISLNLAFEPLSKIIDITKNNDQWCSARYLAKENWTHEWLSLMDKREILQYEQIGTLEGEIKTRNSENYLKLNSIMSHNYGYQVWGDVNRHTRLHVFMEDGTILNVNIASYSFLSFMHSGYCVKDGSVNSLKFSGDFSGLPVANPSNKTFSIQFRVAGKKKMVLSCRTGEVFIYNMGNGYRIYEGICDYTCDGLSGIGLCEFGYNKKLYR